MRTPALRIFLLLSALPLMTTTQAKTNVPVWTSDTLDGNYRNPVLFADFADPDAIRVGDTYYLVCSTFNTSPGLSLLTSEDMVNWRLVGHALKTLIPKEHFSIPRRGEGVWAPSLRHHDGRFWIYYPDPDYGIYLVTAEHFEGPWSEPVLVKEGKGLIDPCPLWDEDGRVYLVHGWARSRSGIANRLTLQELLPEGTKVKGDARVIIDGDLLTNYRTLEGPKIYKREGKYWIFAPAGGVAEGWQSVFRADSIWGPYEDRIILDQGNTSVNGPHQGAWVVAKDQTEWFLHFQDRGAFGRIPHLEPLKWRSDGWPVIGDDPHGSGKGQPVLVHAKPVQTGAPVSSLPGSDDFSSPTLALHWQWEANTDPSCCSLSERPGYLRLKARAAADLWVAPQVLSQRVQGPASVLTASLDLSKLALGNRTGLVLLGQDYFWIEAVKNEAGLQLRSGSRTGNSRTAQDNPEKILSTLPLESTKLQLRLTAKEDAKWQLEALSETGTTVLLTLDFTAKPGWWLGARAGLYCLSSPECAELGSVDVDWVRCEPLR